MNFPDFSRSKALNNIPPRKLQDKLSQVEASQEKPEIKHFRITAYNRYSESNIPLEYWDLKMDKDFHGDPRLLARYSTYVEDLKSSYINGTSICFAGGHGLGKTMTGTCILKKAVQKGYSALYTTLSDIVNILTQAGGEEKFLSRRELNTVDFLMIDEFDPRFMPNENAADLYARTLETVFRTRAANKLPTLMCSNSPNMAQAFNGPLKDSIDSLLKGYLKVFQVMPGVDYRGKKE
jgi:DNA replication protein DnaC